MLNVRTIVIIFLIFIPFISFILIWSPIKKLKDIKKNKQHIRLGDNTTERNDSREETSTIDIEDRKDIQPKVEPSKEDLKNISDEDFDRALVEFLKDKDQSITKPKNKRRLDGGINEFLDFEDFNLPKKKTLQEEWRVLSPEMKACILSGVFDKKK